VAAFLVISWALAPDAFSTNMLLVWLVRLGSIVAVVLFLYPMRAQIAMWFKGEQMPLLSALGMLGGGFGMAMVVTFLLAPQLGVLGIWNFENFPFGLWAQIIAFGLIVISAVWYLLVKRGQRARGINVDFAFKEIPPE
jgi:hypothetical protein